MSAASPPSKTAARITRSSENIQAIPIPRAGHLTHQCPGDVIALITTNTSRITGPLIKNFSARNVLNIFVIVLLRIDTDFRRLCITKSAICHNRVAPSVTVPGVNPMLKSRWIRLLAECMGEP